MNKTNQIRFGFFVAICLVAAVSVAQDTAAGGHSTSYAPDSGASAAGNMGSQSATSHFVLGAADIIHINVWKNVDLSQTVTVGPDGFVSLPLLGDVHVAGMTSNQLALELTAKLNSYIVNPQITVSVVEIRSRQVYVLGQVGKPGGYPLIAPINVLQLIAQAGGLSTYANRKGISILRPLRGGAQRIRFNYNNAVRGDAAQNLILQPGDTVIVP